MEKEIARITALEEKNIKLELIESQLEDIKPFLSQEKRGFLKISNFNFLTYENLRPDCPKGEVREAGITFRVAGTRQRS